MSKAQGDGFRTWTNEALNNYREELRQRRLQLEDSKEKWFRVWEKTMDLLPHNACSISHM